MMTVYQYVMKSFLSFSVYQKGHGETLLNFHPTSLPRFPLAACFVSFPQSSAFPGVYDDRVSNLSLGGQGLKRQFGRADCPSDGERGWLGF